MISSPHTPAPRVLVLVGPTGTGKTAVAVELCELLDGEIVSADSMQIYRGLDIATAKPSAAEKARARHHLVDIVEPGENYSAARWAEDARAAIGEIMGRGKLPIVAGGTGFYLRALFEPDTLAQIAPDAELRAALESEAVAKGATALHDRLRGLDAAAAERLHPNDVRRVIRAIEVASGSAGGSLPQETWQEDIAEFTPFRPMVFGLAMSREILNRRLEARIDKMLTAGFMDELRRLISLNLPEEYVVLQGVGYRQMRPALDDPALFEKCVELWKRDTRRYAKRQMTWFRHQLNTAWIDIDDNSSAKVSAEEIARAWAA